MSLEYKFNNSNSTNSEGEKPEEKQVTEYYQEPGRNRNLTFVQIDGSRQFFNYAYLAACSYSPSDASITLVFSTHTVKISGYKLAALFDAIEKQALKQIVALDKRYASDDGDAPQVTEILIVDN